MMTNRFATAAFAIVCLVSAQRAQAQLTVSPQTNIQELAAAITGPGVHISNVVIDCHGQGYGEFNYTGSALGLDAGVLLTTGKIANAVGPNNSEEKTHSQGTSGNSLLNSVTGRTTYDACRLEFDVIPGGDTLRFNFAFASEEYNEWVGSQYNDVFGFFISGPGIVGDPGIGNQKNIALVPGTNQAVTINNVNNGSNQAYFMDNAGGQHIQYDGITRGMQAVSAVQPCQTYRLKLIIADASDRKFDSGVFVERIQSNAVTMQSFTATGFPMLVEGCHAGGIRFTRQNVTSAPLDVPYFLSGSAINGTDYSLVGNADPAVAKIATIPGGVSSVEVQFHPIVDGIPEGSETIRVHLASSVCAGFYLDSLDLMIVDSIPASVNTPVIICQGTNTTLSASGGLTYTWTPATGLNAANIASPIATPSVTTTYSVNVAVGACNTVLSTTVSLDPMVLSVISTRPLCQGQGNGALNLSVSGGTAPFSFAWSGPNGFTASTEDLAQIGTGTYTVSVTDGSGCSVTKSFNLPAPAALALSTTPSILPLGQNIACFGGATGTIGLGINGGTGPYQVAWTGPNGFTSTATNISSLAVGTYTALVTDQNGCSASAVRNLVQPPSIVLTTDATSPANCANATNGSATISIAGGIPPYSYAWSTSPVQTSATATGLAQGSYTCTVTDGYGCSRQSTVNINAPTTLAVSITNVINAIQCQGQPSPNGSATATASGGTAPYNYAWSTVPEQTSASANFNAGGTYTVTATDASGCTATSQATLLQPPTSTIALSSQTNVSCGTGNSGSATVALASGAAIQSIAWNTVPAQTGAIATGLSSGSYTATATHGDGCQSSATVTIAGPTSPLAASISDTQALDCFGNANGSATVLASGGTGPYTYSWNTSPVQTSATASGLSAGSRTVTVTDALGCTAQVVANIGGPTAALQVSITAFTNVLCFETAQGTADALATGGTAPYTYTWNSSPVQNGSAADDLPEGSYTVSVVDANGCAASTSVAIGGPQFGITSLIENYRDVSCFGANDGRAAIDVTGGSGSYTISWMVDPPQYGTTVSDLPPGQHTVKIEDNNGCDTEKFVNFMIAGPGDPLTVDFVVSVNNGYNVSCHGGADGSIDVTVSGGTPAYNYQWTDLYGGISGQEDLQNLDADTYFFSVTDAAGCTFDTTFVLTSPPAIVVDADITTTSCQGSSTGAIDASFSGGIPPLNISWTGPNGFTSSSNSLTDLVAGVYTVIVSDANGCLVTRSFDVNEPGLFNVSAELSSYPGSWEISCANGSDGYIDVTATGGTGMLSYFWSGPGIVDPTLEDQSGLGSGTYNLTVSDENGCSVLVSYTLSAPSPVTAVLTPGDYTGFNVSCTGAMDGFITADISGGTVLYDISWTGPDGYTGGTANIFGLAPGTYVLDLSDTNGCTFTDSLTLVEPTPLVVTFLTSTSPSGDAIACAGDSSAFVDLTVSGGALPYTIVWQGPDGFSSSAQDVSSLVAGTYAVTVSDPNTCTEVLVFIFTEPAPIELDITLSDYNGQTISCDGAIDGSITLDATGGAGNLSFVWSGPNGFSSNDTELTGLAAGTYNLVATDENNCTATTSVTLQPTEGLANTFILSDFNGSAVSCAGQNDGSIALNISGGTAPYTFEWTGPNGFTSNDEELEDLVAGTYSVIITDANDCTLSASVELSTADPLTLDLEALSYIGGVNVSCSGAPDGAVDMSITGGISPFVISWTDGLGFTSTDEDISAVGAGVYDVIVTDANGCSVSQTITLTSPLPLSIDATLSGTPGANVACAGDSDGSIALDITGGSAPHAVEWNDGSSDPTLSGVGAGTYSVVVSDANGCSVNGSYTLEAPESVSVQVTPSAHSSGFALACADGVDGTLDASATGGTPGYNYTWTGPDGFTGNTADLSGLTAGSYTVIASDASGCTGSATIVLDAPPAITIDASAISYNGGYNVSCVGYSNGEVSTDVSGGQGVLTYDWSGPGGFTANTASFSNASAGTYTLTVGDENGCSASASITLTEPDPLEVDVLLSDAGFGFNIGCDGNDGTLTAVATGGSPDYTFSWTDGLGFGSTDSSVSGLGAGVYNLVVTDANGCEFTTYTTLVRPAPIELDFTVVPNTCPGDETASISVSPAGGAAPFDFAWSGPNGFSSTQQDIVALASGTYSVEVSDAMGCVENFSTTVQGPEALNSGSYVSFYGLFNLQCAGDSTGVIELSPMGGTAPYDVGVTTPNGNSYHALSYSGLTAGDYSVTIIDANGCRMDTVITLTQPDLAIDVELTVSIYPSGTNVSCFGSSDGWIEATVNGGAGSYSYTWRGPDSLEFDTPNITGLPAGDYAYELVVVDANQCSFFTEVTLTQPDSALIASATTSLYHGGVQVSCATADDGSIELDIAGGSAGYTVDWSGANGFSATGTALTDLSAGTYNATITDFNGCVLDVEVVLNAPEPIVINLDVAAFPSGTGISCNGANDGSITATITGGTAAYVLDWEGPNGFSSSDAQLSALVPGEYCLSIIDANGCTQQSCIQITEPEVLSASASPATAACGEDIGSVSLTVDGGSAPYSYLWSNGANTQDLSGLAPGAFDVLVTDANGCTTTAAAIVDGTPAVIASGSVTSNICNGDEHGSITLDVSSGTAPFTYDWSNGSTTADQDNLASDSYTVVVSGANGCSSTLVFDVQEPAAITIDVTLSSYSGGYNVSTYGGNNGSISTSISGGTAPYTYSWSNGSTSSSLYGLIAGDYAVEVTDVNGCTANLIITITQPDDLIMPTGFSPNGDGANDTFFIRGLDAYPSNTFVVFNRWGNVVYDRLNYRNDWSGENIQGQALPNGTYFVILTVNNGERTLQGYVDLRR